MKFYNFFSLNLLALNMFCAAALANDAQSTKVTAEVAVGLEHDSNVNIVELDKNSRQSDIAALLGAKIYGKWQASEKLLLSGGYSASAKTYQHESTYDLFLHQFSADASYTMDLFTWGASYHCVDANLNKKDFLELQQNSVYLAKLINSRIYLRAAINLQDKQFSGRAERNAENIGFTGDMFVFFNEGKTFVALGLTNENENSRLDELDYSAETLKVKLSHQYPALGKQQKLQLGWRYAVRDYAGVNSTIERERYDSAHISELEWEVNFTAKIATMAKVEYSQYDSNLPSADYSETRTSITLTARF
ncbi:MAG: surface lipoprotein assembly modifier [Pseudomonadota bacterium]